MDTTDAPAWLMLGDGRRLAYQCFGQPGGRPMYFFHGFPGCRLQAALVHTQALAAGVCLVSPDRPGFGRSSPAPGRTLLSWADDVAALADHLQHHRFAVMGVSCGGPYALACARQLAPRLDFVGLLAGIGPLRVAGMGRGQLPMLRALFTLARWWPPLVAPLLGLDRAMFRQNPERAVRALASLLTAPDRALLSAQPAVARAFAWSLAEAYQGGIGGALREAHLIGSDWGFALEEVHCPVHVYQSGLDRHVPPAMGRAMAERLPASRWTLYAEEGHLSIVVHQFQSGLADWLGVRAGP